MYTKANELEAYLRNNPAHNLWPAELNRELMWPRYDGYSIANVPATIARVLGRDLELGQPLDGIYWQPLSHGVNKVVVLLLDAMGYLQLTNLFALDEPCLWRELAPRGIYLPMTSLCPSTTTTVLATLATGEPPIRHGMLGYELWLAQFGTVADMITPKASYSPGRETLEDWGMIAESFMPVQSLGQRMAELGIRTTGLIPAQYLTSSLSRMLYRGFERQIGYSDARELMSTLRGLLENDDATPGYYFVYWSTIDTAMHRYGNAGGYWQSELRSISKALRTDFMNKLTPQARRGVLFAMTADHGWVETPVETAHDLEHDELLRQELLGPYSGESRAAYLHCLHGDSDRSLETVRCALGGDFWVLKIEDALAANLWGEGEISAEVRIRLGHLLALARGQHYLDRQGKSQRMRGRHGGLDPAEMLIPWLALCLDGM